MITVSNDPLLVQPVNHGSLIPGGSHINLEELVDLSSLKFFRPFLGGISIWVLPLSSHVRLSNAI